MKFEIEITYQKKDLALATEMFEVGDFWLEIRVIIKILSLDIQKPLTDFHRNETIFFKGPK